MTAWWRPTGAMVGRSRAAFPSDRLFAELLGRRTGTNAGRAGSPYVSSPKHRFIGENSIVGAGAPIACGVALAAKARARGGVVISTFGDGATSQGSVHEAVVAAAAHSLPVIFVCENNGWSENTPIRVTAAVKNLSARAFGYGIPGISVDGNNPEAVFDAIVTAVQRARSAQGASFVECMTHRLGGHYHADIEHYRSAADRELAAASDPLPQIRAELSRSSAIESDELDRIEQAVAEEIRRALETALASPAPDASSARNHVVATPRATSPAPNAGGQATELNYGQALNEAIRREMAARPSAVVFGEDVAIPNVGGVFGVTRKLHQQFGGDRVFDTAITENAILGMAVGASQEGMIPIVEIMWSDFLLVGIDQLINQAANVRYLHSGDRNAQMVVRCQQGVTQGSCAQHSQSLEAILAHVPGLHVGMPATARDAYAMLRAAVAEPDPCILIESRSLYLDQGPVYLDADIEPIGGARITATGTDVAIVSWGRTANLALEASRLLEEKGVGATVVDLRWLTPLDHETLASVASTCGRVVVAHEANLTGGFGAEVVAAIVERSFFHLDAPPMRVGAPDVRIPSAPVLQQALMPNSETIAQAALSCSRRDASGHIVWRHSSIARWRSLLSFLWPPRRGSPRNSASPSRLNRLTQASTWPSTGASEICSSTMSVCGARYRWQSTDEQSSTAPTAEMRGLPSALCLQVTTSTTHQSMKAAYSLPTRQLRFWLDAVGAERAKGYSSAAARASRFRAYVRTT